MIQRRLILSRLLQTAGFPEDVRIGDLSTRCGVDLRVAVASYPTRHIRMLAADTTPDASGRGFQRLVHVL